MMVANSAHSAKDSGPTTPGDFASSPSPHVLSDTNSFALQAIMEMQKTLGEVKSQLGGMKDSVDSMKSKVDQLVAWKNMIFGGAIALGIVISVLSYVIGKGLDYVTIKAPPPQVQQAPMQQPYQPKIP